MNVVTGSEGEGSAVLIRALEPLQGIDLMKEKRHMQDIAQLTNGPAKLCKALGVDKQWNGHNLRELPLQLCIEPPISDDKISETTRIGISRDAERLWRFYIAGNQFVSKR